MAFLRLKKYLYITKGDRIGVFLFGKGYPWWNGAIHLYAS